MVSPHLLGNGVQKKFSLRSLLKTELFLFSQLRVRQLVCVLLRKQEMGHSRVFRPNLTHLRVSTELLKVGHPGILFEGHYGNWRLWHRTCKDAAQGTRPKRRKCSWHFLKTFCNYSLENNFVGFAFDWRRAGFVDGWQLNFGWRIASQVLKLWFVICKPNSSHYSNIDL